MAICKNVWVGKLSGQLLQCRPRRGLGLWVEGMDSLLLFLIFDGMIGKSVGGHS